MGKNIVKLFKSVIMSIQIIPIEKGVSYYVNGKEVFKDSNNEWLCREELTMDERKAFINYKTLIIESQIKKHTKATYRV